MTDTHSSVADEDRHPPEGDDLDSPDHDTFEDFFENATVPMHWVGPDGSILRANQAELDALGYDRDEYVGHHIAEFHADQDVIDDILDRLSSGEELDDYEARMQCKDGSMRHVLISSSVNWENGEFVNTRCVTRDITERREHERELTEQRERYRRLVDIAPVAIGIYDTDGEIVFVNDAGVELMGADDAEAMIGESALEYVHPDDRPAATERMRRVLDDREAVAPKETRIVTRDGDVKHVVIRSVPITDDGAPAAQLVVNDITAQKARERELQQVQERMELALEATDAIVWDWNIDADEATFYPSAESLYGTEIEDWEDFIEIIHPDDREAVTHGIEQSLETGKPKYEEVRIIREGEIRWIEAPGQPVQGDDGSTRMTGVARDITELKERERALEESERRYRALAENFPNGGVGVFDEDLRYTLVTGPMWDDIEPDPDDLEGKTIWDALPAATADDIEPIFLDALDGKQGTVVSTLGGRTYRVWATPLSDADDEITGGLSFALDLTERIRRERRLEASNERLERFAHAASHDLQEPLRMVSTYLQLLEDRYADDLDDDSREFLAFAVNGADRMRKMIDSLLEYSRIENDGEEFDSVELDAVLDDVVSDLAVTIDESSAAITADPLPRVEGDANQLRQLFQNLVDNAIKYSGDDPPRVHISADRDGREWVIAVRDEGIGMEPAEADRVFGVFERLHSRDEHRGTGVGLALCERIVERHHGDIWIDSEPGVGTTVSFTLLADVESDGCGT